MTRSLIQIYHDIGSSSHCTLQLLNALNICAGKFNIVQTNGELLRAGHKLDETALLCFGGGYDLGYLTSLKPDGFSVVREFILSGGRYLGLCAGAYFASKRCVFDKGGPLEVIGDRPIGLFDGEAVGPYLPGFRYNSEEGSYAVPVMKASDELSPSVAFTYFNGGCTFRSTDWAHSKVLYHFGNSNDPAIILSNLGKGFGILSGVHLEYNPDQLAAQNAGPHSQAVVSQLQSDNDNRLRLWKTVLSLLLNSEMTDSVKYVDNDNQNKRDSGLSFL